MFKAKTYYPCCNDSILIKEFDIKTLNKFLGEPISEDELEYLKAKEKQKIYKKDNKIEINQSKEFLEYFYETDTKIKRDLAILSAYKDGYTQVKIATHLKLVRLSRVDIQSQGCS